MKGDFSRIRFNPKKQYTAVLQQQGRVSLDADANEQCAIDGHLRETTNIDVIGQYGGPIGDAGFAIEIVGPKIVIHPGRYYVDGLLVEIADSVDYDHQPYLDTPAHNAADLLKAVVEGKGKVTAQFRLEVWQRLATELDDHCLQEPALGQADTTVRLQTVWRVLGTLQTATTVVNTASVIGLSEKIVLSAALANDPISKLSPSCQLLYKPRSLIRTGALGADTGTGNGDCGCQPIASAGFQGLENQLYRIEIHTGGDLGTATFKWSRENASVVSEVTAVSGAVVTVSSLGPDANLGFQVGQWVELVDDKKLFGEVANQPGTLYQILSINTATLQVTMTVPVTGVDLTRNARMRRWEQSGALASATGLPLSSTPVPLENGIEVTFRAGIYQPGDYWTIPARTASGQIDWPPCGGDGSFFQPPKFVKIHTAPLACVHSRSKAQFNELATGLIASNKFFTIDDCRLLFPPLTWLKSNSGQAALHVKAISWVNDDVMTVDALLEKGLSVTFDQATICPWGGGNFRVTLEAPLANDPIGLFHEAVNAMQTAGKLPNGTDVFLRSEVVLDPPEGITVVGSQVEWLLPAAKSGIQFYSTYWLFVTLNTLLIASKATGFGRVRVQLLGSSVYASGNNGNIYLDGMAYGTTVTRSNDGAPSVNLAVPSGNAVKASDFESWFYLAPTVLIAGVVIQAVEANGTVSVNAVTVAVNSQGVMTGLQTGPATAPVAVTALQALITLTYPPIADTLVTLTLSGTGIGNVVSIQSTVTVLKGQISVKVPIQILASPGSGITDSVTLGASVSTAVGNFPWNQPPSLAITGGVVPIIIF